MGRKLTGSCRKVAIPIIDRSSRIIAWTEDAPEVVSGHVRHAEAERLIGRLECIYVSIENREDAVRAGAPPDWRGPWRCLALCDAQILEETQEIVTTKTKDAHLHR